MNALHTYAVRTLLFVALASMHGASQQVLAAPPVVEFDAPGLVAAEDITTAEFRATHPGEKLIAARLELSALVARGEAAQLTEVIYRVETLDGDVAVFDFGPKTQLEPLADGNLSVERDTNSELRLNATANARYFPLATADASVSKNVTEQSRLRYELPAPQELVVAAGTWQRQRGVFVKLRATRRVSLEGAKPVAILFTVPQNWRGGVLRVEAEARANVGGLLGSGDTATATEASFLAGMYLAGDIPARNAVQELVASQVAEAQLQSELAKHSKAGLNRQVSNSFGEVVTFFDGKHRSGETKQQRAAKYALDQAKMNKENAANTLAVMNANPRQD